MPQTVNEAQRRQWNDETRLTSWLQREPLTARVTETLLEHAAIEPGETILDVGCGGGRSTIPAARLAGPSGSALGADLSAPLVALASERAAAAGVTNVRFTVADVQQAELGGGPFSLAISQFGVMFFQDSVAAFARIRAQLRPGSRLAFACWQPRADNPWFNGAATELFVPPPPPPTGPNPTGPFALGNPAYTTGILTAAGWSQVRRTPYRRTETVDREVLDYSEEYLGFLGVPANRIAEARAATLSYLAPLLRADGQYDAPLAFQIFAAAA